jgi:hypothetical protein
MDEKPQYLDEKVLDALELLSKHLSGYGHVWSRDEIDLVAEVSMGCAMLRRMREMNSTIGVVQYTDTLH